MSYVVKGFQGVTVTRNAPQYNAETGQYTRMIELKGPEPAIRGMEQQLIARGRSYRTDHDGPVWTMWVEEPELQDVEELDRWEIFTESVEKSLFELPDAVDEGELFNVGVLTGSESYKSRVESAVTTKDTEIESYTTANKIIRHLRAGVTGWQLDLVGLRRSRRFEAYLGPNYRIGLETGLLLYTTSQLNLPDIVAFSMPSTPSDISDLFKWRWRKRSQRVEIIGSYVEQTTELIFAPWSTLAYSDAGTNLAW